MLGGGQWVITVAMPDSEVQATRKRLALRRGLATLLGGALMFPLCMVAIYWAQRPLGRLGREIIALDAGRQTRLTDTYPADLSPVASKINHLMAAYEQLLEANRTRADMLAHNIRSSLASLTYKMERLSDSGGVEDALLEYRQRSREILRYVNQQVSDSSLSATDAGIGVSVDPEVVITRIVSALQRLHAERGITWHLGAGTPCLVACSSTVLGEIMFNILDNAGKWARSCVSCDWKHLMLTDGDGLPRKMIEISVADDGPGFSANCAAELTAPGDADAAPQKAGSGLGIGFELACKLARFHDGNIVAERGERGGALVRIQLPCAGENTTAMAASNT